MGVQITPTDYAKNLSWRRWPILIIFMFFAMSSSFQITQFVVIPQLFSTYFQVDLNTITWTNAINSAAFILLLIPAMVFVENNGLRNILLIASGLNAIGAIIKCAMIKPELFWLATGFQNSTEKPVTKITGIRYQIIKTEYKVSLVNLLLLVPSL